MLEKETAQQRFDKLYITSHEIEKELKVERSSIFHARKRGLLPDPVQVGGARSYIWERASVRPYLDAWKITLQSRRGELA